MRIQGSGLEWCPRVLGFSLICWRKLLAWFCGTKRTSGRFSGSLLTDENLDTSIFYTSHNKLLRAGDMLTSNKMIQRVISTASTPPKPAADPHNHVCIGLPCSHADLAFTSHSSTSGITDATATERPQPSTTKTQKSFPLETLPTPASRGTPWTRTCNLPKRT